jgi:plastocyanin/uncharacterized membrane protein YozB (DUF420 family)
MERSMNLVIAFLRMNDQGFDAPVGSNLNLAAQILMGILLLVGTVLARRKLFRAHGVLQSIVILLNLIPIMAYMGPVFHRAVLPKIPAGLGKGFYALPAGHATLGTTAEVLGLYIILRAGTNLLPDALRFKNYKLWMRTELVLWWVVIALGLSTYWIWYGPPGAAASPPISAPAPNSNSSTKQSAAPTVTVSLTNFAFDPKELTIEPGTTVIWKDTVGRHAVKAEDDSFESDVLPIGGEFQYKFEREGRFPVYCTLHGAPGGHNMAGVVIVKAHQH